MSTNNKSLLDLGGFIELGISYNFRFLSNPPLLNKVFIKNFTNPLLLDISFVKILSNHPLLKNMDFKNEIHQKLF